MAAVRWTKDSILGFINSHIVDYPTPINLNYFWSFGSTAGICLVIQILTGVFLAMHYTPHVDLAFYSIEHIMRDVNNGWLIRYLHANGASMFFHCGVFSYFSRVVLWIVYQSSWVVVGEWCYYISFNDGYSLYGLCITLGSDEFLGSNCNYQFIFSNSDRRCIDC